MSLPLGADGAIYFVMRGGSAKASTNDAVARIQAAVDSARNRLKSERMESGIDMFRR